MTELIEAKMPIDISADLPNLIPGSDWKWSFYVQDDNGGVQNTTGYSARFQIRTAPNGELLKELSTDTSIGGITNVPASGRFDVAYLSADTELITVRKVVLDVVVTDDAGEVNTPFKAELNVYDRVTK